MYCIFLGCFISNRSSVTLSNRVIFLTAHVCVLSSFSHVWLFATPWTIAHQAPLSLGFSRQEYWNGLPCPPPGDLPDPGMEPALVGRFFTTSPPGKAQWEGLLLLFSGSIVSDSLRPYGLQYSHTSLSSTIYWSLFRLLHWVNDARSCLQAQEPQGKPTRQHLDLRLPASGMWDHTLLLFKPRVCAILLGQPE